MCGILGVVNFKGVDGHTFRRQLEIIHHRGPDSTGLWSNGDGTVYLGSKRLAIQDLSNSAFMPMLSDDKRYAIVFNGEVYNFQLLRKRLRDIGFSFNSGSDTEVVLKSYIHYGVDFLNYVEGMFAVAIYDMINEELILARDRIGEKPLYVWENSDGISFASQMNQLFMSPTLNRDLDYNALHDYLSYGYVNDDKTLVEGIKKILPGTFLKYSLKQKRSTIKKYWEIPSYSVNHYNQKELTDKLDELLRNSVKKQLISDVPVGVLLSGGIDSSLITAYASELSNNKLQTFHISLGGYKKYNESKYAQDIANYFDTSHVELSGDDIDYSLLDVITEFTDEPLSDSSLLPSFLVAQLTSRYLKVVLGGDGGDELFGGYKKYKRILNIHSRFVQFAPNSIRNAAAEVVKYFPVGVKGRQFMLSLPGNLRDQFVSSTLFDNHSIGKIIPSLASTNLPLKYDISNDLIYDLTKIDMLSYLPNDILFKVDRSSMAYSLETRAPFLDKSVVEFAFRDVNSMNKINGQQLKILPKLLLAEKVKLNLDFDRKQGFSVPLDQWFKTKWFNNLTRDIENFEKLIDKEYATSLLAGLKKGRSNAERLFALVMLDKWLKKNQISY